MSIMVTEVYEALVSAGAPDDKAKAGIAAIPIARDLATKEGLAELWAELKQDISELRAELNHDTAGLKAGIAELRATLRYNTMFLMLVIGLLVKLSSSPDTSGMRVASAYQR